MTLTPDLDKVAGSVLRLLKKKGLDASDTFVVFDAVLDLMGFTDIALHHALRARESLDAIHRDLCDDYCEPHRRWEAETARRGYPINYDEAAILSSIGSAEARLKKAEKWHKKGTFPDFLVEQARGLLTQRIGWLEAFWKAKAEKTT